MKKVSKVLGLVHHFDDIKLGKLYKIEFNSGISAYCQCLTEDLFEDKKWMISVTGNSRGGRVPDTPFAITPDNFAGIAPIYSGRMYHVEMQELREGESVTIVWRYRGVEKLNYNSYDSMEKLKNTLQAWRGVQNGDVIIVAVKKVKWTEGDRDDE